MPCFQVERPGLLLDVLKRQATGWKVSTLKQRLKHRLILVDGSPAQSGAQRVEVGVRIEILSIPPSPESFLPAFLGEPPLPILYADAHLIAIDKPFGLLSVASEREKKNTAVRIMRDWFRSHEFHQANDDTGEMGKNVQHEEIHAAHRLDREASGVLLLTRNIETKRALAAAWHGFEKKYIAVADGVPAQKEGVVDLALWEDRGLFVRPSEGGIPAVTRYRMLKQNGTRSLLEIWLDTGRKHQIRVHMASIGCPLVGDRRYGVSKAARLALHASCLRITHPVTGEYLEISSPTPTAFKNLLH